MKFYVIIFDARIDENNERGRTMPEKMMKIFIQSKQLATTSNAFTLTAMYGINITVLPLCPLCVIFRRGFDSFVCTIFFFPFSFYLLVIRVYCNIDTGHTTVDDVIVLIKMSCSVQHFPHSFISMIYPCVQSISI